MTELLHSLEAVRSSDQYYPLSIVLRLTHHNIDWIEQTYALDALHQLKNPQLIKPAPPDIDEYLADWNRFGFCMFKVDHAFQWERKNFEMIRHDLFVFLARCPKGPPRILSHAPARTRPRVAPGLA
jgi:hypothetical protein